MKILRDYSKYFKKIFNRVQAPKFKREMWEDQCVYCFWCPGCNETHWIPANREFNFNGDLEKPTVYPGSIITRSRGGKILTTCEFFIKNGKIQFSSHCTHLLAGQTVKIPDWEKGMEI